MYFLLGIGILVIVIVFREEIRLAICLAIGYGILVLLGNWLTQYEDVLIKILIVGIFAVFVFMALKIGFVVGLECPKCGKVYKVSSGKTICQECGVALKNKREKPKEIGSCTNCGGKINEVGGHCSSCGQEFDE